MIKKPNLTQAIVSQIGSVFLITMRLCKGIEVVNEDIYVTEKPHSPFWFIHILFSWDGREYSYTFHRKPTWKLIDPMYMIPIIEKIMNKFQIPENKERANILLKELALANE